MNNLIQNGFSMINSLDYGFLEIHRGHGQQLMVTYGLDLCGLGIQLWYLDIQKSKLHCFDYNYKGRCIKPVCTYKHTCMKCQMKHPSIHCFNINGNQVNAQTRQNNGYGQPTQEVSQFHTRRGLLQRPNQSRYTEKIPNSMR